MKPSHLFLWVLEHNIYNQFGFNAFVANNKLLNGHPQATISATTTRLRVVAEYNVLKKENYLLTCAWHFRPATYIDPFTGIDIGFTHFSLEDDELFKHLKNTAMLFNVRMGVTTTLLNGRLRPVLDGGFAMISSSTVFHLFWSVKICYDVTKWGGK